MSPSSTRQTVAGTSPLGLAPWRFAGGLLYVLALLTISVNLLSAVCLLLATLLCFPATRTAFRQRTGLWVGGVVCGSGVMLLMLAALVSVGWQVDVIPTANAAGKFVSAAAGP